MSLSRETRVASLSLAVDAAREMEEHGINSAPYMRAVYQTIRDSGSGQILESQKISSVDTSRNENRQTNTKEETR